MYLSQCQRRSSYSGLWRAISVEHLQSVNDTWNVTQDREENVDEEVGIATALEKDAQRR